MWKSFGHGRMSIESFWVSSSDCKWSPIQVLTTLVLLNFWIFELLPQTSETVTQIADGHPSKYLPCSMFLIIEVGFYDFLQASGIWTQIFEPLSLAHTSVDECLLIPWIENISTKLPK